jgi:hypothetical protein
MAQNCLSSTYLIATAYRAMLQVSNSDAEQRRIEKAPHGHAGVQVSFNSALQ